MSDYEEVTGIRFVTDAWPHSLIAGDKPIRYPMSGKAAFSAAHSAFGGLVDDPEHFKHYPVYSSGTDVIARFDDAGNVELVREIPMSSNTAAALDVP